MYLHVLKVKYACLQFNILSNNISSQKRTFLTLNVLQKTKTIFLCSLPFISLECVSLFCTDDVSSSHTISGDASSSALTGEHFCSFFVCADFSSSSSSTSPSGGRSFVLKSSAGRLGRFGGNFLRSGKNMAENCDSGVFRH